MSWAEHLHPRDPDDGRFVEKHGGWLSGVADQLVGGRAGGGFVTPSETYQRGRDITNHLDYAELDRLRSIDFANDQALAAIWRANGFDGKPESVDETELDGRIANGWHEMHRGVGVDRAEGQAFADQFRGAGAPYPGLGGYGNGTYAAPAWRTDMAEYYGAVVVRMALRPDANIVDINDVWERMAAEGVSAFGFGETEKARALADAGRWASAKGIDAIRVNVNSPDTGRIDEWIILNRTALAIQARNHREADQARQ